MQVSKVQCGLNFGRGAAYSLLHGGHRAALISGVPEVGGLKAAQRGGQPFEEGFFQTWGPTQSPARAFLLPEKVWTGAPALQQRRGAVQCVHLTVHPQKEPTEARSQLVGVRTRCLWR